MRKSKLNQVREPAALWFGTCALVLGVSALGAWWSWLGLLLSLPLLLGGLGYAIGTLSQGRVHSQVSKDDEGEDLGVRELRAARFASPAQTLTFAAGAALFLNLMAVTIVTVIMLRNAGYVGPDYELSATYVRAGKALLPALGSLASLSVLALAAGRIYNWSPKLRAAECAAPAGTLAARFIKSARVFNTVVLAMFLFATLVAVIGLISLRLGG